MLDVVLLSNRLTFLLLAVESTADAAVDSLMLLYM